MPARVLIIDDDPAERRALAARLGAGGHEVIAVSAPPHDLVAIAPELILVSASTPLRLPPGERIVLSWRRGDLDRVELILARVLPALERLRLVRQLASDASPATAPPAAPPPAAPRRRILFVDDEVRILRSYRRRFRDRYEVDCAESLDEAIDHLVAGDEVDLVVSDLLLGRDSGAQLIAWIHEHRPALIDRFVLVTANRDHPDARAFASGGRGRLLEKPFGPDALEALIG